MKVMIENGVNVIGLNIVGQFFDISTNHGYKSAFFDSFSEKTLL